MNFIRPVSWVQNHVHGWVHYLYEYMKGNIFCHGLNLWVSYTGLKWSGGSGLGLGLESKSCWSFGWYKGKSEKIDSDHLPDQRIEGE